MAWYEIEYKCGHKDRMQLYGSYKERDRRIEWYKENVICPACRAARQKEEAAQQKKADSEAGLPNLSGSPKQIQWAVMLRKAYMDKLEDAFMRRQTEESPDVIRIVSREIVLGKQTEAKWWIDHRDMSALAILKGACKLEGLDSPEKRATFAAGEQPKSC